MKELWFQEHWNSITSLDILLVGMVGRGTSSLINGLLGEKVISTKEFSLGIDHDCVTGYTRTVHGVHMRIWDASAFFYYGSSEEELDKHIAEIKVKCHSVDLVLYFLRMDESRFYQDDRQVILKLKNSFSRRFWDRTFFILTFANKIEPPKTRMFEKKEYFTKRLHAWVDIIKQVLESTGLSIDEETLSKRIIPAGFESPHLPDRMWWLSKLWHSILEEAQDTAQGAILKLGLKRMIDETTARDFNFDEYDLHHQPIVSEGTWWQSLHEWTVVHSDNSQ